MALNALSSRRPCGSDNSDRSSRLANHRLSAHRSNASLIGTFVGNSDFFPGHAIRIPVKAGCNFNTFDSLERLQVFQAQTMYGRLEALIATAVHIPQLKDVSHYCCTNRDVQFSAAHSKILLHDFRVVDRGVNDQHKINLSVPFEVSGDRFVRQSLRFRYRHRRLNSRDNQIPELITLAVEGSRMPAQTAVH